MPEIKHTPGPWFVEQSDKTPIYVSPVDRHEQVAICNVMVIDEDAEDDSGIWFNGDQTKANAKLIAAAPDLLASLQRVMSWIDNWSPDFTYDDEWPADRDSARAAIAKATA